MSQQTTIELESKIKGPVTCLGQVFASEDTRREHFRNLLREKLKDPDFRQIEGFPIGEDEDIIALSDPPYYTACPNPWINDFIAEWEKEKGTRPDEYHREPFAADVSEGKNDPIYNAHSYHTKVPHKAIMRYILHYTEPGDIVFDGFCGTGMTGVAAQLCGDRKVVESLGYTVRDDGTIMDEEGKPFSKLGARKAILNDLSPAATFIAANYNSPVDLEEFEREARRILEEVEEECGWMYETMHTDGKTKGKINYTVWSDVFICPNCSQEVIFWDVAVDKEAGKVKDEFPCPHCGTNLTKRSMERAFVSKYDPDIADNLVDHEGNHIITSKGDSLVTTGNTIKQAKQVPVLINYTATGKRFEKEPDDQDLSLIERTNSSKYQNWYPTNRMPAGDESRRNDPLGLTHTHQFYSNRSLMTLASMLSKGTKVNTQIIHQAINATLCTRMVRYNLGNRGNGTLSGTLYISSLNAETNPIWVYANKYFDLKKAIGRADYGLVSTCSASDLNCLPQSSVNYIFTDPPFGSNLMYSELNYIWESWLKIITNN